MHSQGYAYQDFKMSNIMLDDEFNIKIVDFGFSRKSKSDEQILVYEGTE